MVIVGGAHVSDRTSSVGPYPTLMLHRNEAVAAGVAEDVPGNDPLEASGVCVLDLSFANRHSAGDGRAVGCLSAVGDSVSDGEKLQEHADADFPGFFGGPGGGDGPPFFFTMSE